MALSRLDLPTPFLQHEAGAALTQYSGCSTAAGGAGARSFRPGLCVAAWLPGCRKLLHGSSGSWRQHRAPPRAVARRRPQGASPASAALWNAPWCFATAWPAGASSGRSEGPGTAALGALPGERGAPSHQAVAPPLEQPQVRVGQQLRIAHVQVEPLEVNVLGPLQRFGVEATLLGVRGERLPRRGGERRGRWRQQPTQAAAEGAGSGQLAQKRTLIPTSDQHKELQNALTMLSEARKRGTAAEATVSPLFFSESGSNKAA